MTDLTIYKGRIHDTDVWLRAVVFWDSGAYFASCIEKDVGAQADTPAEALRRLAVAAQHDERHIWQNGLTALSPAPAEMEAKWQRATVDLSCPSGGSHGR